MGAGMSPSLFIGGDVIEVNYNGKYPCACMGDLIIKENGIEIYNKKYCCYSTGCVTHDGDYNFDVESGDLIWEDAHSFKKEIQDAVREVLMNVNVCCGGCI